MQHKFQEFKINWFRSKLLMLLENSCVFQIESSDGGRQLACREPHILLFFLQLALISWNSVYPTKITLYPVANNKLFETRHATVRISFGRQLMPYSQKLKLVSPN